jgi:hypothetical protein
MKTQMKITSIPSGGGMLYKIEDVSDNYVVLNPSEAVLVLQFLYERVDELTRLVNELPGEPLLQQCPYCGGMHPSGTVEQCPLKPSITVDAGMEEDMKDMQRIRDEWRAYRNEGLGDRG